MNNDIRNERQLMINVSDPSSVDTVNDYLSNGYKFYTLIEHGPLLYILLERESDYNETVSDLKKTSELLCNSFNTTYESLKQLLYAQAPLQELNTYIKTLYELTEKL